MGSDRKGLFNGDYVPVGEIDMQDDPRYSQPRQEGEILEPCQDGYYEEKAKRDAETLVAFVKALPWLVGLLVAGAVLQHFGALDWLKRLWAVL